MGEDIPQPSQAVLRQVADELIKAKDAEHPNACLRCGTDEGPMFVIDAYAGGTVILTKYPDQDSGDPLDETKLINISAQRLFELWLLLASGSLEKIRLQYPECRW
jgi:hypothetical protein